MIIIWRQSLTATGQEWTPNPFKPTRPASHVWHTWCETCHQVRCFDTQAQAEAYRDKHRDACKPGPHLGKRRIRTYPTRPFTDAEDAVIRSHSNSREACKALPGRTVHSVRGRAQLIGHQFTHPDTWTEAEDQIIRESTSVRDAAEKLPNRSWKAVKGRAHRIGRRWKDKP